MAEPKRDLLMAAIVARMMTITTPVYHTNIGVNVFEFRTTPIEDHELPAVNVEDGDERQTYESAGAPSKMNRALNVSLEMLLKEGSSSIQAARKGLSDMEKAIGTDVYFGGLALDTDFVGSSITKDQKEHIVTGAKLNITVIYRTTKWADS